MAIAGIEPSRVEAIVYDLGNVLVEIDFGRVIAHWAGAAGVEASLLRPRFALGADYEAYEVGGIDLAAYFATLRRDLGVTLDDATLAEGWNAVFVGPIAPTIERVGELASVIPQYAFSNTNAAHHEFWSRRYERELAPLRGQFVSHRMRLRKPDRKAFEHVAREIGVAPDRVLFFDDLPANVEGARAAGMQAVVVRGPGDVAGALTHWLGKPRSAA